MTQTKRKYHATFILDNRGREETIDQIIEGVKKEIAAVQGEITAVENLGKKDFARITEIPYPTPHTESLTSFIIIADRVDEHPGFDLCVYFRVLK